LYKTGQNYLSKIDCNNYCNQVLKKQEKYNWLKEVDKFALTNSIYNLDKAYRNYFRELKKGNNEQGFPKFKSKKDNNKSYTTNFTSNNIKVDFKNSKIQLPKLKWIKCKIHRKFNGKILFATISKTPSGKYFVSFNVEVEHIVLSNNNCKIGIDLGIKDLLKTSNGGVINNEKITYKYENKLAKLQRKLAKKQKGSKNRDKQRIKVARLHEKITNVRKNNLHYISKQITNENKVIICEDLNVKGMVKNHNLSKSIHDCGWGELTRQLQYKSEWNNKLYYEVNRYFPSSQLCNKCGYRNNDTKNLGVRFWTCPQCGEYHDRDEKCSNKYFK